MKYFKKTVGNVVMLLFTVFTLLSNVIFFTTQKHIENLSSLKSFWLNLNLFCLGLIVMVIFVYLAILLMSKWDDEI